ncbi:hypothetical protein MNV49_007776 [Pseudohyphozyma bogoriensis]|nr:hypothetical protein MNV49_007776 [Pseudohyphozyma bogoriensis]
MAFSLALLTSTIASQHNPLYLLFPTPFSANIFLLSSISLVTCYTLCDTLWLAKRDSEKGEKEKRLRRVKARSWLLTGFASLVLSVGSMPFLWDFASQGFDVAKVQRRELLASGIGAFFVAYLVLDLAIGMMYYKSQVSFLTGYFHHTAYTFLLLYLLHLNIPHVFCLAAVMEVPTLILAVSMLFPQTRSDMLFTSVFFITRIAFHSVLLTLFITPHGYLYGTSTYTPSGLPIGSYVPFLALSAAAPLHITWFSSSVRGMLKRRRAKALGLPTPLPTPGLEDEVPVPLTPTIKSPPSPFLLPLRPLVTTFPKTSRRIQQLHAQRQQYTREVSRYFRERLDQLPALPRLDLNDPKGRDENDVLRGLERPRIEALRVRAGKSSEDIRRLGGRLRRRVQGGQPAETLVEKEKLAVPAMGTVA